MKPFFCFADVVSHLSSFLPRLINLDTEKSISVWNKFSVFFTEMVDAFGNGSYAARFLEVINDSWIRLQPQVRIPSTTSMLFRFEIEF